VFNDSVHGHIEMPPLLVKIIDTPEFQRLRNIKQLGGGYYVFPGASHNRFEHSIGVAHLAGKLVQNLRARQNLDITIKDELCVQIAGLCHDLGHGPFSHTFEVFMKEKKKWEWPFEGRTEEKSYLYEIVANRRTGIDVDKMDYFSRDSHHLGMKCNFSHERYMMFARVCTEDKVKQICMRDKEAMNMYELFHIRNLLHHKAYQHRVTKAVELMIIDALKAADEHFHVDGKKISDAESCPKTYIKLTDDILQQILCSSSENLTAAQSIIERILKRDLYKLIGQKTFKQKEHLNSATNLSKMLKTWVDNVKKVPSCQLLTTEDFRVLPIRFNYGKKEKNPIEFLRFYSKDDPDTSKPLCKEEVPDLKKTFEETKVMLFYKGLPKKHVNNLWEELIKPIPGSGEIGAPSSAAENDNIVYQDITATVEEEYQKTSNRELSTSQKKAFSENGLYKFYDQKTFRSQELKHLDSAEKWKIDVITHYEKYIASEVYKITLQVFNDSVHGHIEMPPLLVKIIDTLEFQRLRNIKQLGGGYFVYPGASHNRFEHSIGVAHLAGKLVQKLSAQKDLGITEKDILCVQIAGLCHDLGHGPFSHTFDEVMKELKKKRREEENEEDEDEEEWKVQHEAASVIMFEHLIEVNGIEKIMRDDYKFDRKDFLFIMEMIYGPNPPSKMSCCSPPSPQWPYRGREKEMSFLYQIVANRTTGIDVDKMDYFSRDCLHLGMKCNFSFERYMMFARVCTDENGDKQICVRDKEAMNMYELFQIRYLIRKNACHHRVTIAVELMLVDAIVAAANDFLILNAADDPNAYTNLTDEILHQILRSSEPEPNPAKEIIQRIFKRDLYTFIGDKIFDPEELSEVYSDEEWKVKKKETLVSWLNNIREMTRNTDQSFSADHFKIVDCKLNYGMKEKNPIDSLKFYTKDNPDIPIKLSREKVSHLLPAKFSEIKIMLFYKGKNQTVVEQTKKHVDQFWNDLDPIFLEVNKPSICVDLRGFPFIYVHCALGITIIFWALFSWLLHKQGIKKQIYNDFFQNIVCPPMQNLAQEIIERISKQGTYKLIVWKTFSTEELIHLKRGQAWRFQERLEEWLLNIKEQGADQSLTADDFKVVSAVKYMLTQQETLYAETELRSQDRSDHCAMEFLILQWHWTTVLPPCISDVIEINLFYKGQPKQEVEKFSFLFFCFTEEDLQNLNQELSKSERIKDAVSKGGLYMFIEEKTFLCEELKHLNSPRQREDQRRAWLNHVREDGGTVATEGFIVTSSLAYSLTWLTRLISFLAPDLLFLFSDHPFA
ncbi:hypothetical protein NFI96_021960, partial [Prochilodus magdalenae]